MYSGGFMPIKHVYLGNAKLANYPLEKPPEKV